MERLLEGVTDDGWQYLDDNLIAACYRAPLEWLSQMRRIVVVVVYVKAVARGFIPMEEESSNEEEDTKEET